MEKICWSCSEKKNIDLFYKDKSRKDGHTALCKSCSSKRSDAYRKTERGKETCRASSLRYSRTNKGKIKQRSFNLRYNYGMSEHDYMKMIEIQKNRCAICNDEFTETPHVDHCHKTNKIRELLCGRCNKAIGYFRDNVDNLSNAIKYLNKHLHS